MQHSSIPYGGATTTCEALFMGVPVITLGLGMVRRLSKYFFYSDCKDWIASNSVEYLEKSSSLAKGIRKLKQRISLRNKVIKSNIGNGKDCTRNRERGDQTTWRNEKQISPLSTSQKMLLQGMQINHMNHPKDYF